MTKIYDVLLVQQQYIPGKGYSGEKKYICVFYDTDKKKAIKAMGKYVDTHGFSTPDKQFSVSDVVLRERLATGEEISMTPYIELFNPTTGKERT